MGSLRAERRGNGWRVINQVFIEKKRKSKIVPRESYFSLGINPAWSFDEVSARCSQINKQQTDVRIAAAAASAKERVRIQSAYLPPDLVAPFEADLAERPTQNKDMIHWRFVQVMIADLKIDPADFIENRTRIYRYFQKQAISFSYAEKVMAALNMWGKFVCRRRRAFYDPVPSPSGVEAQRVKAAWRKAKPNRGASEPLTPQILERIRDKLPSDKQRNWLAASVWFGLRPEEIDLHRCEVEREGDVDVLWVYQPKLTSIDEERRWKPIPILYPGQRAALAALVAGDVCRPLNKVLKGLTGSRITGYGGRKGFVDLMMDLGQKFEDISVWMGHTSIQRTWQSYKDRQRVRYTKVAS